MGPLRLLLGALLACALTFGGYALAARATVSLTSAGPQPGTVTVDWGDTVGFANADTVERTVTSPRAELSSGPIPPGGTFDFRFLGRTGTYRYSQLGSRPTTFGFVVLTAKGRVTLAASRTLVPFGAAVTYSGRSSYPGTPVQVQFRPAGATGSWTTLRTLTAADNGTYSGRLRFTSGGRLRAVVAAGQIRSSILSLTTLPKLQIRLSRARAAAGTRIVVRGRILPAGAATSVDLEEQRQGDSRWQRKATGTLKRGVVTFGYRLTKGRVRLRLVVRGGDLNAGFAPAQSRSTLVTGT